MPDAAPPISREASTLEAAWTIAVRELVAFFRQRSRVLAAIITPLFLWLMLGMGMGQSFQWEHGGGGFLAYFFPGIVVFAVVFAGIYSSISTILDRQKGILQSVVVAPISRTSIVFGKVLGGTLIALVEGSILLLFVRLAGIPAGAVEVVLAIAVLALLCYAMTGIGFYFAWMIDSVQGYHAIMNLILMPAWLLSGAFFPRDGAATWVRVAMDLNPLYYGLSALRHVLWLEDEVMRSALPSLWLCLAVTGGLALVMTVLSARAVTKKTL